MTTKNNNTTQVITEQAIQPSNYTRLPNNAIYELDIYEYKLLGVLMHMNFKNKNQVPNKTLASMVGCSVNKMKNACHSLQEKGYIFYTPGTKDTLARVEILYNDIWEKNKRKSISQDSTPLSQNDTLKDTLKSNTLKDSLSQENAKGVFPDIPDLSDHENPAQDHTTIAINETSVADWQAKILAELIDAWIPAGHLEVRLFLPDNHLAPLSFVDSNAYKALQQLVHDRQIEFVAKDNRRRYWRLHPDGQPAPKFEFDLLHAELERCLDLNNGVLNNMTHMLRGTSAKKDTVYYTESQFFKGNPVQANEVQGMVDYFVSENDEATLPARPEVVSNWFAKSRKNMASAAQPEDHMTWHSLGEEPPLIVDMSNWENDDE